MFINKIVLRNYCQHVDRTIEVKGNLIAVVGTNGVGKSNLLGAVQFALTGEQPGKNKADLLHWGAKDGYVALEFTQDGKPGYIERHVTGPKVILRYGDGEVTGITAVEKAIARRLRFDKDLLKQAVFVRQTEVDAIISSKTEKRARETAFQKLIGIDAAKVHKNLTDWLYAAKKPVSYDSQRAETKQQLEDLKSRKARLDESVARAQAEVDALPKADDGTDGLRKCSAALSLVLERENAAALAVRRLEEAYFERESVKDKAGKDVGKDPGADVLALTQEINALMEDVGKAERRAKADEELSKAKAALSEIILTPHPSESDVAGHEAKLAEANAKLAAANSEAATRRKSLSALSGGETVCPVCGAPLSEDAVSHIEAEARSFEAESAKWRTVVAQEASEVTRRKIERARHVEAETAASARVKAAEHAIHGCEPATLAADVARAEIASRRALLNAQTEYDDATRVLKEELEAAKIKWDVAKESEQFALRELADAKQAALALCGDEASKDWSQAKLSVDELLSAHDVMRSKAESLRVRLASEQAARDEVVKTIGRVEQSLGLIQNRRAEEARKAKALATLQRVRDWFSYQNGPRVLTSQVLAALTTDVNKFLGNFTAPFIVIPDDEQLGFKVEFTDGRDKPDDPPGTDVLSGGERVQLAVAFRLAIYAMFAGKLGLLSLDEPTAYLDDTNVDRFGTLLSKVKELARNMNTQVFMATHERAVIPHMDSIIDLN